VSIKYGYHSRDSSHLYIRGNNMALSLESISKEACIKAPKILLLGAEKIGKSSFACGCHFENGVKVQEGINDPIVISIKGEEGTDALKVGKFPISKTYEEVMEAIGVLYQNEHEYKTVVLDSVSTLQTLIYDDVCSEFNVENVRKVPGFRTGEAAVMNRWRSVLDGLDALRNNKGMASIIVSHIRIRNHKNPEGENYDIYDLDLDMSDISEMLKRWADLILFANTKVVVKKDGDDTKFSKAKRTVKDVTGGQRFLFTQKRPAHPGGGRDPYGALPYELPLDWASFEEAVANTIK